MTSQTAAALDSLVARSLRAFAADVLGSGWRGKEHDWVNRYTFGYLVKECAPGGPLHDPAQLGVEVGVAQPPGYAKPAANRDLVIWGRAGMSCWSDDWLPTHHPLTILEWKVHRPGHVNRDLTREREWLRQYTAWQAKPVCYAVEVTWSANRTALCCSRFHAGTEVADWLAIRSPAE